MKKRYTELFSFVMGAVTLLSLAMNLVTSPKTVWICWLVFSQVSVRVMAESLAVGSIAVAMLPLLRRHPKVLGWSWLRLVGLNPMNISLFLYRTKLKWVFIPLVIINFPLIISIEEAIFRRGLQNWQQAAYMSLAFGLVHCLFGLPLFTGIILTGVGAWLSYHYLVGGFIASTAYHVSYDIWSVLLVVLYVHWKRFKAARQVRAAT